MLKIEKNKFRWFGQNKYSNCFFGSEGTQSVHYIKIHDFPRKYKCSESMYKCRESFSSAYSL